MARREELTRFLKSVRGRLQPTDVGLPSGSRRRAPGLRREEVATLAGMSVTWYTWFEQGREVQLSAPMLERLGAALKLSSEEREYLFALAQHRPPPPAPQSDQTVSPSVRQMIDSLNIPAQVITENWTLIAWNRMVTRVFADYDQLPPERRNLFRALILRGRQFADEASYRDMVKRLTARLKWDYSRTAKVEYFDALIAEMLDRSELFREYWSHSDIVSHFEGEHTVPVDGVGDITFRHTSYAIEAQPSQRLVLYAPVGEESIARLKKLAD